MFCLPIARVIPLAGSITLLHGFYLLCDILDPAAVHQLMEVQGCATVRALGPLLRQPSPHASVAAELRAVGTHVRVHKLLHADEAPEHLHQRL